MFKCGECNYLFLQQGQLIRLFRPVLLGHPQASLLFITFTMHYYYEQIIKYRIYKKSYLFMQNLTFLIVLGLAIISLLYFGSHSEGNYDGQQFRIWQLKYGKQYEPFVEVYRLEIFKENKIMIERHNKRAQMSLQSYTMGINKFSDLTEEEWAALYLSNQPKITQVSPTNEYTCNGPQPSDKDLPQSVDWSAKSAVTAVRDQGLCIGANHAIVAVEAIQSARFISSGKLIELSAQQVIDCTGSYGNKGCISGNVSLSYSYIYKTGIASEKKYPYRGFAYQCAYNVNLKETGILGCVNVTPQKEISIKAAVRRQPVAVSLNAAKLKNYQKGVYESNHYISPCKTEHNHWMLLVGYAHDSSHKKNYWKLKNSWGSGWGQQGYLYIVRKGDGEGQCGVQTELYYPLH